MTPRDEKWHVLADVHGKAKTRALDKIALKGQNSISTVRSAVRKRMNSGFGGIFASEGKNCDKTDEVCFSYSSD